MGNQLASRKNLTVYQQDAQKYWAKIQTTNYCQIVKHGQTQKIGQMYYKQTQNLLQQANNYQFRKDNAQYLVSALSIFKTNHIICSEVSHFNVIIQRIPFRFADLGQITYDQGLYIINQSLRGFEQLRKKIGVAHIEDTLICINNHGKCKVWINENISQNFPNQKIDVAQNQQVNELLQIVQQKISKSQLQRRNYGKIKQHYQIKDFKSAILFIEYLIRQSGLRINQVRIPDYYLPQSIQSSVLESIRKSTKKKSLSKNHSAKYALFKFDNCNKNVRTMLQRRSKQKAFISPDKNLRLYTQVNDNSVYSTKQQDELTQSYTPKNLNKTLNFGKNDISPVNIKTNHNINQVTKIQRTPKKKQAYLFDLKFKTQQKNKILYQQPIIQRQSIYWSDIKCNYEGKNGRDFSRTKPSFNFNVNTSHFNKNDDQWMVRGKTNHENDQSLNKTKDATPQNSILDSKFHNNRVDLKYNRSEAIRQILNRPLVADKYFRR